MNCIDDNFKMFEYCPKWIKKDVRVEVYFNGEWQKGTVIGTVLENDRGIDIETDEDHGQGNIIGIPVYMAEWSKSDWKKLIRRLK